MLIFGYRMDHKFDILIWEKDKKAFCDRIYRTMNCRETMY